MSECGVRETEMHIIKMSETETESTYYRKLYNGITINNIQPEIVNAYHQSDLLT